MVVLNSILLLNIEEELYCLKLRYIQALHLTLSYSGVSSFL